MISEQKNPETNNERTNVLPSKFARVRMEPLERVVVLTAFSSLVGGLCGAYLGGQNSGRQYLAERAHRLPKTVQGWYFYQKWKNYRMILGGFRCAAKYGGRVGGCILAYSLIEAVADRLVGEVQAASSVVAGLGTAIGISLAVGLPRSSAHRARIAGVAVGLSAGLLQDIHRWRLGAPPAYVLIAQKQLSLLRN